MAKSDERRSRRAKVLLTAVIENGPSRVPVRVSNLSAHGVLVIGNGLPASETRVVFHCNGIAAGGWIAWAREGHAGIEFDDRIEPEKLIQRLAVPQTVAVPQTLVIKDTRQLDFRRPGFRGNQLTDEQSKIVEEWNRSERRPINNEDE